MDEKLKLKAAASGISRARQLIISSHPFFGRLLMRLPVGFADCDTACTDMKKILFCPDFALRLSQDEIVFVLIHELMHCVLKHCVRGKGRLHFVYNISCDIVVNSIILEAMGKKEFSVDGTDVMHLAPDGKEGRLYSAEEIYIMLMENEGNELERIYGNGNFDNHGVWEGIDADKILEQIWDGIVLSESKSVGGCPAGLERMLAELEHSSKIDWRQVLHDFIQQDRSDYTFMYPDRRFQSDILLPSFCENIEGESVRNLWFAVDTSGSISDRELAKAYAEITDAIRQIGSLSGYVSFFDCDITKPVAFESVEDLMKIRPVGGGGTSFRVIFSKMTEYFEDKPECIIILTDGYAEFPDEKKALGVPVLWIIIDSDVEAPWGECVNVYSD